MKDPTPAEVAARYAIADVVARYCRGIDRRDMDLVRSCYHDGAVDHHGSFTGDADAFVAWVSALLDRYDGTFHFTGNQLVEFVTPAVARVETYGVAMHWKSGGADHLNLTTGFRYIDRFEHRTDAGWAIASRHAITEWSRRNDPNDWFAIGSGIETGRRDGTDRVDHPVDSP